MGEHGKCYFHGGASTGPDEPATDHLEDNDHAAGNSGGGPPELNTNAATHGAACDWRKVDARIEGDAKAYVDRLYESYLQRATVTAGHLDAVRQRALARELAVSNLLWHRATIDTFKRGMVLTETVEYTTPDGETETFENAKLNPAQTVQFAHSSRQLAIRDELGINDHVTLRLYELLNGPISEIDVAEWDAAPSDLPNDL
jgi:hypothetical protein